MESGLSRGTSAARGQSVALLWTLPYYLYTQRGGERRDTDDTQKKSNPRAKPLLQVFQHPFSRYSRPVPARPPPRHTLTHTRHSLTYRTQQKSTTSNTAHTRTCATNCQYAGGGRRHLRGVCERSSAPRPRHDVRAANPGQGDGPGAAGSPARPSSPHQRACRLRPRRSGGCPGPARR